jgi:HK97 family phage prohead protease
VLGRESAGTLTLTEDANGLRSVIDLPDTQLGRDLAISVERGDIREQSFCFTVAADRWEEDHDKKVITRTILEVKELIDISPVTYPAYPDTDIAKRSFEKHQRAETGPEVTSATARQKKRFDLRNKESKLKEYLP